MGSLLGFLLFVLLMGIYFIPAMVAAKRGHKQAAPILVLNLFLGWTLIGWVISLVWACSYQVSAEASSRPASKSLEDKIAQSTWYSKLDELVNDKLGIHSNEEKDHGKL
jgi:Superinfection immunity protein